MDQTLRKLLCQAPENSKAQRATLMLQALGAASPLHEALDVHNRFLAALQLSWNVCDRRSYVFLCFSLLTIFHSFIFFTYSPSFQASRFSGTTESAAWTKRTQGIRNASCLIEPKVRYLIWSEAQGQLDCEKEAPTRPFIKAMRTKTWIEDAAATATMNRHFFF